MEAPAPTINVTWLAAANRSIRPSTAGASSEAKLTSRQYEFVVGSLGSAQAETGRDDACGACLDYRFRVARPRDGGAGRAAVSSLFYEGRDHVRTSRRRSGETSTVVGDHARLPHGTPARNKGRRLSGRPPRVEGDHVGVMRQAGTTVYTAGALSRINSDTLMRSRWPAREFRSHRPAPALATPFSGSRLPL